MKLNKIRIMATRKKRTKRAASRNEFFERYCAIVQSVNSRMPEPVEFDYEAFGHGDGCGRGGYGGGGFGSDDRCGHDCGFDHDDCDCVDGCDDRDY